MAVSMAATDAGTRLDFEDGCFDVAFSNSVIEHLSSWQRQEALKKTALLQLRLGDALRFEE